MLIGTVSSQIRMSFLKNKADRRIQNIHLAKGNESLYVQSEKMLKQQQIETIKSKLKSGLVLSQSELAFLRENSPQLYAKAIEIAKERAEYREELSKCKTKDDVQKVNNGKLQELVSTAQQVSGSTMNSGEKLEQLEFIQMRMSGIMNEHVAFISTPEYQRLPWEHEKQRDEKKKTIKLVSSRDRLMLLEAEERERRLRNARLKDASDTSGRKKDSANFGAAGKKTETAEFGFAGKKTDSTEFGVSGRKFDDAGFGFARRKTDAAELSSHEPSDAGFVWQRQASAYDAPVASEAERQAVSDPGLAARADTQRPAPPDARAKTAGGEPKVAKRRGGISIIT